MSQESTITIDGTWTLVDVSRFFTGMCAQYLSIESEGRFVGILARDSYFSFLAEKKPSSDVLSRTSVVSILRGQSLYCSPDQGIHEVFSLMKERGLKFLAVKCIGKVVGVISYSAISAVISADPGLHMDSREAALRSSATHH